MRRETKKVEERKIGEEKEKIGEEKEKRGEDLLRSEPLVAVRGEVIALVVDHLRPLGAVRVILQQSLLGLVNSFNYLII